MCWFVWLWGRAFASRKSVGAGRDLHSVPIRNMPIKNNLFYSGVLPWPNGQVATCPYIALFCGYHFGEW